jgi:hypothetical protein
VLPGAGGRAGLRGAEGAISVGWPLISAGYRTYYRECIGADFWSLALLFPASPAAVLWRHAEVGLGVSYLIPACGMYWCGVCERACVGTILSVFLQVTRIICGSEHPNGMLQQQKYLWV